MKHEYKKITPVFLISAMLFTGCGTTIDSSAADTSVASEESNVAEPIVIEDESVSATSSATTDGETDGETNAETSDETDDQEYFSDRDLSGEIDRSEAIFIELNGDTISSDSDTVSVSNSTVTISEEGTYILTGELEDGYVVIDAPEDAKIQLVLDGASIHSETFAPIYVAQADKVFVTLAEGTENELSNGGSYTLIDDNNVDGVIYSKDDLTLNGSGSLTIQSPAGHGIVGKDDVVITGGTYSITAAATAVRANDSIAIADGTFTINADSDGLHAENDEDDTVGNIYIQGGTFDINAGDDGIHATTTLIVDGGTINIQAIEGMEATNITINDGEISIEASDDGINASNKSSAYSVKITFNGGNTTVSMGAGDTDGVDANGDIEINGGTIDVTCNSAFDYDNSGVINGGTVIVNGEEVTVLTNQMMGGGGQHNMDGGPKGMGERPQM